MKATSLFVIALIAVSSVYGTSLNRSLTKA